MILNYPDCSRCSEKKKKRLSQEKYNGPLALGKQLKLCVLLPLIQPASVCRPLLQDAHTFNSTAIPPDPSSPGIEDTGSTQRTVSTSLENSMSNTTAAQPEC